MKTPWQTTARWIVIVSMVMFAAESAAPMQTHAQYLTEDLSNLAENIYNAGKSAITAASSVLSSTGQSYLVLKASVLDPLAWAFAKALIQEMVAQTVNWINSGFKGNPAFLTNPDQYFLNAADQATGAFIANNGPLAQLCSPFSLDIRLSIALQQAQGTNTHYTCTLSQIIANAENVPNSITINGTNINGFMNGDFSQGGWPAFISMTTEPQNNYVGAYFQANSDLTQQIANKQNSIQADLQMGSGFLSYQSCEPVSADEVQESSDAMGIDTSALNQAYTKGSASVATADGYSYTATVGPDGNLTYQDCQTETPGSVISASLNKELGASTDSLVAAHEVDEVIGALATQLLSQVLGGGLHSVSQPSSGSTQSFISQMEAEVNPATADIENKVQEEVGPYISRATQYKSDEDQAVALISNVQSTYATLLAMCQADNNATTSATIQGIMANQIAPLLSTYEANDANADTQLQSLTGIQTLATSSDPGALAQASQEFSDLILGGNSISPADIQNGSDDVKTATATSTTLMTNSVQYQNLCPPQVGTSTVATSTGPTTTASSTVPVITSADVTTGTVTGQNFMGVTDAYLVSVPGGVRTDLSVTVTNNTSLSVIPTGNAAPFGQNALFLVSPSGTSAPYFVTI